MSNRVCPPFKSIRQSMLNLFCNCQVAFYNRYVEQQIMPPGIAARVGSGLHKAAEINHKQKIDSGMDMPISDMRDAAATEYARLVEDEGVYFVGSSQDLKKELGKGEDLAVSLAAVYGSSVAPKINPVEAEITVYATHPDLEIPFSGTLDVINDSGAILDLKTASKKWRAGKERETTQSALYKFMAQENYGQDFDFGYHVLTYDGQTQFVEAPQNEGMERIVGIAKAMLNACETGVFMPAVPGHWICSEKWCGWHGSCPYAQK